MSLDERFSAWLDGELEADEIAELEAQLESDPSLAAEFEALQAVRDLIRSEAILAVPAASAERIITNVETMTPRVHAERPSGRHERVRRLQPRRRVPVFAAVAASFAIIVGVVAGVGSGTTIPAVGELVELHAAAASNADGAMDAMEPMDDMDLMTDMGMDSMMDDSMVMMAAQVDDDLIHAVYEDPSTLLPVSVFRQDGDADLGELVDEMDGGDIVEMGDLASWQKDVDGWHVVVLDGDGYTWTIVTPVDMEMDSMMVDMMDDLPSRDRGVVEQMRSAVVDIFS